MPLIASITFGKRIGEGHFGEVFEALDPVKGKVAVKKLKIGANETPEEFKKRGENLIKEGQNLQTAKHTNVVQVLQVLKDGDDCCLVIEYCERSLSEDYSKGPMQLHTVRDIATQVCRGLQNIHARGLLHRDIKPSNILAENKEYKISDFGLVSNEIIAGYASAQGYQDHLAIEVWRDKATSIKSDIWALGMTIYRLLHGKEFYLNHFGKVSAKPQKQVTKGKFAKKLPWLPHIPESWRRIIRKAMHDDTEKRFQTVNCLCRGLSKVGIKPRWECDYSADRIQWWAVEGKTKTVIECHAIGKKFTWFCEKATQKGKRTVRKAKKPTSKATALKQLTDFFASLE